MKSLSLFVGACLALAGSTAFGQVIHSNGGGGNWSSASTWTRVSGSASAVPVTGDHVIVSSGSPVVLDVSGFSLAHLEIHDTLRVADTQDCKFEVARIDVGGPVTFPTGLPRQPGRFVAGTAGNPFRHDLTIKLTDDYLSPFWVGSAESTENMSFIVHGNSGLSLHGVSQINGVPRRPWVQLADLNSLIPGDTSMRLEALPGWQANDELVIASTDYDMLEAEELTISSTTGQSVAFTPALVHHHHGVIERGLVDERAEVGLLSHNIVITSEVVRVTGTGGREDIRAGHLMCHNRMGTDPAPRVSISYTEFREMGWKGALGRYPIHFHLLGDTKGISVQNSSVHHCFNRSVTVHGTNGVLIEGVVAYDTYGHSFYLEDRSEVNNRFVGNLGLVTRMPTLPIDPSVNYLSEIWAVTGQRYFCFHDTEISTFWITNTKNEVIGNHAAGCERHGFWYDCGDERTWFFPLIAQAFGIFLHCDLGDGLKGQDPVVFEDNSAHSNGVHGFWNDPTRLLPADLSLPNPLDCENHFVGFTAYKNRNSGIWHRGYGTHRWIDARLADNRLGAYLSSEGFQYDGMVFDPLLSAPLVTTPYDNSVVGVPAMSVQTLEHSVVIGQTANEPMSLPDPNNPYKTRKGIVLYDGLIVVTDTDFYDFVTEPIGNIVQNPPPPPTITPNLTHRVAVPITSYTEHTQSERGHPWNVDPRNAVGACTFTNCTHPVLFPIPHAPTVFLTQATIDAPPGVATLSPNGVIATTVLDLDGCVPGSFPGAYITQNVPMYRLAGSPPATPLAFGHYADPLIYGGPGTADDEALAQLLMVVPGGAPTGLYSMTLNSVSTGESQEVFDVVGSSPDIVSRRFPMNIRLTVPNEPEEVYQVTYPAGAIPPPVFTLRMQFSAKDRPAVFRFPYPEVPTSIEAYHDLFPGLSAMWTEASTLADFNAGVGHWYHDAANSELWVRSILFDGTPLGIGLAPQHPVATGRSLTLSVTNL